MPDGSRLSDFGDINLAPDLLLNSKRLLGQRLIIQGASGAGKSRTLRKILESLPDTYQQIIIDVEDEFHTLRTEDRPYAILGGEYADADGLEDMDVRALAPAILELRANTILQINDLPLSSKEDYDQRQFIADFIAGAMAAPRKLWRPTVFVLDESHRYAPEKGDGASLAPIVNLCTAGRKRSFSALFATQRFSMISKDVLGQCPNKMIGRCDQALDVRAAADVLGFTPRSNDAATLYALQPGEMWTIGPAFGGEASRHRITPSETVEPEPGAENAPAPPPEAVARALAALPRKEAQEAEFIAPGIKADAAEVSVRIEAARQDGFQKGRLAGLDEGRSDGYRAALANMRSRIDDEFAGLGEKREAIAIRPPPAPQTQAINPPEGLTTPQMTVLEALWFWLRHGHKTPTRAQVAAVCGWKATSGHLKNVLGALRTEGLVDYPEAGRVSLTVDASKISVPFNDASLRDRLNTIFSTPQRSVFDAIAEQTAPMDRVQLAGLLNWSPASGHLKNVLGSLRTLELIDYPSAGMVALRDWVREFL